MTASYLEMTSKHTKSVGFILSRRYSTYDELIDFCCLKKIDFWSEYEDYKDIFRIYMFSFAEVLQVINFIKRRKLDSEAVFVNITR
jgi:hypothetical protein